jgi:hypothetical protein
VTGLAVKLQIFLGPWDPILYCHAISDDRQGFDW